MAAETEGSTGVVLGGSWVLLAPIGSLRITHLGDLGIAPSVSVNLQVGFGGGYSTRVSHWLGPRFAATPGRPGVWVMWCSTPETIKFQARKLTSPTCDFLVSLTSRQN